MQDLSNIEEFVCLHICLQWSRFEGHILSIFFAVVGEGFQHYLGNSNTDRAVSFLQRLNEFPEFKMTR